MEKAKSARRQGRAAVTRILGTMQRFVAEENTDGVKIKLDQVKASFVQFEASHDVYHDMLEVESEIEESDQWFQDVQANYIAGVTEAKTWLKSQMSDDVDQSSDKGGKAAFSHSDMISLISIPKVEIDKFDGDPLEYHTFISVFDELVDRKVEDAQIKLTRLLQYTSGTAKAAIRNCALVGGEAGYRQARHLLENRFGNTHLVSQQIIDNLKNGKSVTKPQDLQQLGDDLSMALTAMMQLGRYDELNNQQSIIDILQRCQPYVRNRWRKKALEYKREHNEYPSLREFVDFINLVSSEVCDPVYGTQAGKGRNIKGTSCTAVTDEFKANSVGLSSESKFLGRSGKSQNHVSRSCTLCGQNHGLFYCDTFKGMRPESRLEFVNSNKLCRNCLMAGHFAYSCHKRSVCTVPGCGRKHTKFIHVENSKHNTSDDKGSQVRRGDTEQTVQETCTVSNGNVNTTQSCVYLPVIPVIVNGQHRVNALLDSGSTSTFVTGRLADSLNLRGHAVTYMMNTLASSSKVQSKVVSFDLMSVDGTHNETLNNVMVVSSIPVRYPNQIVDLQKYPYLEGLPIHLLDKKVEADILLGMDNAHLLMPLEVRSSSDRRNQPYAIRTLFGWSLNGPVDSAASFGVTSYLVSLDQISQQIEKLWHMERFDEDVTSISYEDQKVIDLWNKEISFEDGHYILPIPWRDGRPKFPDNSIMATNRLTNLSRKLERTGMFDMYSDNVKKLMDNGYAEPVPIADLDRNDGEVWYLPHHGVLSESKPGKLRVVFDCAAKRNGISLNSQCLQGPDLNNKLIHVLLRFRQYKYAIMADIEAMYHQVKVPPKDRDALRFLWFEEGKNVEYRMTSHLFGGVWCASSSTFALRRTVQDSEASEMVKNTVNRSFYVDDLLKSVKTPEEAIEVITGTKQVLKNGGFNLTKFVVNDPDLLETIHIQDRAKEVKDITPEMSSKALGIRWDVLKDFFYFVYKGHEKSGDVSKRVMLSQLSSMYDPLGLVSPIILRGKVLFQKVVQLKVAWDLPVPETLAQKWSTWRVSLGEISKLKFPRCVIPEQFDSCIVELHHFCDASEVGYGACSYIRAINQQGKIHVALIASKSRVAPIKQVTIPRLELSAAVVAVKLDSLIRRELEVPLLESTFWTDSSIVLAYIQSESKRFKVFVANKVSLIRQHTAPHQWHHVDGKDNPADILSRGCEVGSLPPSWMNGPQVLWKYKSAWPIPDDNLSPLLSDDPEVKQSSSGMGDNGNACVYNVQVVKDAATPFPHPIDALTKHFSSFYRLKKALCWLVRMMRLLKGDKSQMNIPLTVQEMSQAESLIIKHVQHNAFQAEIKALQLGKNVAKSSPIYRLSPVLDNGLLVVGGRLKHATVPHMVKFPAILPHDHRVSELIVQEYHGSTHLGVEWTLSQVRRKFWITHARNLIKKMKQHCITCKRLYGVPLNQKMADLPPERCEPGKPPFSYVGVDLFGPFHVKLGRSEVKRYGCIYTCFTTRAIHIEMLNSLETDAFINGFIRFTSRRGYPIKVWSDNGTNLVGAKLELARSLHQLDRTKVVQAARRKEVEWTFNPPLASHFGGVWERMIRTIRKVLFALLDKTTKMVDDVLHTLFCEVENIVNSRPITKCSDDIEDDVPLTPNHLLLLQSNPSLQWGVFNDSDTYRKHWRHVQYLSTQFWRRWSKEYLLDLQRRCKWNIQRENLKVGDLVLVADGNFPRGSWPLGIVVEVLVGRDNLVRSARVRTRSSELVRPITKLVFLEGSG